MRRMPASHLRRLLRRLHWRAYSIQQRQCMRIIDEALTFDDVLLEPAYSEILPREVSLETRIDPPCPVAHGAAGCQNAPTRERGGVGWHARSVWWSAWFTVSARDAQRGWWRWRAAGDPPAPGANRV